MLNKFKEFLTQYSKSENTIRGYVSDIKWCLEYFVIDEKLSFVNLDLLMARDSAKTTKYRKIASLKKYAKFLFITNIINSIPRELEQIEVSYSAPRVIQLPEKNQIQKTLNHPKNEIKLLANLLYYTGARIDSISNIKVKNIFSTYIIIDTAKGDKPYVCPITDEIHDLIMIHLSDRSQQSEWLFTTKDNKRATANCLRMKLKRTLKEDYVNPHSYRHNLASMLADNGVSISDICSILNHKSIITTQRYIHQSIKTKEKILQDTFN